MYLVFMLLEVGQGLQGEDDGGDEDAGNGDDAKDSCQGGGVRMLKKVPELALDDRGAFREFFRLFYWIFFLLPPIQLLPTIPQSLEAARLKGSLLKAPEGKV